MYIGGADYSWIFLYKRLPRKTTTARGVKYTEEDVRAMADAFAEFRLTEYGGDGGLKVKQALARATKMGMSNLDEGIAKTWSHGRIVLVGDACHKFTPNAGHGFNTGLQDVVALCNLLRRGALEQQQHGKVGGSDAYQQQHQQLPLSTLISLFEQYHDSRRGDVASLLQVSSTYTRIHTMASFKYRLLDWLMESEWVQKYLITRFVSPGLAKSLIVDYVPFEDPFVGSIPWATTCRVK